MSEHIKSTTHMLDQFAVEVRKVFKDAIGYTINNDLINELCTKLQNTESMKQISKQVHDWLFKKINEELTIIRTLQEMAAIPSLPFPALLSIHHRLQGVAVTFESVKAAAMAVITEEPEYQYTNQPNECNMNLSTNAEDGKCGIAGQYISEDNI